MRLRVILILLLLVTGCSRSWYRRDADKSAYGAIGERHTDDRWYFPSQSIDPPIGSRLHDPDDPDHPAMPPDDPAAHEYMLWANGIRGSRHWYDDGKAFWIEDPGWKKSLPLREDGILVLTSDRAVELGLLHSREYQTALESMYLTALGLTLNRFEFQVHWFGTNNTFYDHFGNSSLPTESNTLTNTSELGLTRNFACGGQLMANLVNSWVWEYTNKDSNVVASNVVVEFVQPLLRLAGRRVRMELLTQAERDLLYSVRTFARFRKEFTVDITTRQGGYLSLLLQVQNIRNLDANLKAQQQNLRMHEALFPLGVVSAVQVDQVFQTYQAARLLLLQSQTGLENSLDTYKLSLGLPPNIPVELDDSLLAPFQLTDPALPLFQDELEKFQAELRQPDVAPPLDKLKEGFAKARQAIDRIRAFAKQTEDEIAGWKKRPLLDDADEDRRRRETNAQDTLKKQMESVETDLSEWDKAIERQQGGLTEAARDVAWKALQIRVRQLVAAAAQVYVVQSQVRVYLIRLPPVHFDRDMATSFALEERLDLMNRRAEVVDAWRKIEVAASALKTDASVVFNMDIGNAPDASHPFDLSALSSRYRVGLQIDGPLNRLAERNIYRRSLINYQVARRQFMLNEDTIRQSIRRDLRQLENERLNFEIGRQSLIVAARQVEFARENLLLAEKGADRAGTLEIINALRDLLAAKSTLIQSWVSYRTTHVQLLLDLEMLQLDERGLFRYDDQPAPARPSGEPVGPPAGP